MLPRSDSSRRRLAFLALAGLQLFSAHWFLPGGDGLGLSYFRLLLIACVTVAFVQPRSHLSPTTRKSMIAAFFLAMYMFASSFFVSDLANLFREISYVIEIFLMIYAVSFLLQTREDLNFAMRVVGILCVPVVLFAFYEIETGYHLNQYFLPDAFWRPELRYKIERQAWVTFGNPNDLCVHVLLATVLSCLSFLSKRHVTTAALAAFLCISLFVLANALSSRTVLVAFVCFVIVLIAANRIGSVFVASAVFAAVMLVGSADQFLVTTNIQSDTAFWGDTSSLIRARLGYVGWQMFSDSLALGTGAGTFEDYVVRMGYWSWTFGIVNPHNAYVRFMGESGVIGLALYCYLVFAPSIVSVMKGWKTLESRMVLGMSVVLALSLIVGSNPNSSSSIHLFMALYWLMFRNSWQRVESSAEIGVRNYVSSSRRYVPSPRASVRPGGTQHQRKGQILHAK